jgi:hypothetical protein
METECIQNEFEFQGFEPKKMIIKKGQPGRVFGWRACSLDVVGEKISDYFQV